MKRLRRWLRSIATPFTEYRFARRLCGGKWERWFADPIGVFVWIPVDDWTPAGQRPGGCAIWASFPAPNSREDFA